MDRVSWNPETGERLEDEWERDNVYAPVDEPFRPIPTTDAPLNDEQKEYGKLQVDICRQVLASLKGER